jgi:hypothetical protein
MCIKSRMVGDWSFIGGGGFCFGGGGEVSSRGLFATLSYPMYIYCVVAYLGNFCLVPLPKGRYFLFRLLIFCLTIWYCTFITWCGVHILGLGSGHNSNQIFCSSGLSTYTLLSSLYAKCTINYYNNNKSLAVS